MEISYDKIKIKELLDLKQNNMLTVNPEYQRGAVWKAPQQKKLIDSVFRSYPLPLIYLHHKKKMVAGMQREDLEIIDGQQRINALNIFSQGALKLFDPIKDDKSARFPIFIKNMPCPWAGCDYYSLPVELKEKFDNTELSIVKVTTDVEDEARDLFIRLQAGLPLNAQEKRDAWPGGFTEFTLKFGGKSELLRYPGHEFFHKLIFDKSVDRGEIRTLCAQIGMLFFEKATEGNWADLGTQPVDEYYYRNIDFDINSPQVTKFGKILDLIVDLFQGYKGPRFKVHEAIHVVLLVDSLFDDYTKSWQGKFIESFDTFREKSLIDKKAKSGDYWFSYVVLTHTTSTAPHTIQRRHEFFSAEMIKMLQPVPKDTNRIYGQLEREIIYYRDSKKCAVCGEEIKWEELEIHHINEHQFGGKTTIENGVAVHICCHPKGQNAIEFDSLWQKRKKALEDLKIQEKISRHNSTSFEVENSQVTVDLERVYKIESAKEGVVAFGKYFDNKKFTVLKGSTISSEVDDSFGNGVADGAYELRTILLSKGVIDSNRIFTEDYTFSSISQSACVILGGSRSGPREWK